MHTRTLVPLTAIQRWTSAQLCLAYFGFFAFPLPFAPLTLLELLPEDESESEPDSDELEPEPDPEPELDELELELERCSPFARLRSGSSRLRLLLSSPVSASLRFSPRDGSGADVRAPSSPFSRL